MTGPEDSNSIDGGTVGLDIEVRAEGLVAHLILDHPERRNAMGPAVTAALHEQATRLVNNAGLRLVTLRGAGGFFSAGANVNVMAGLDPDGARAFITSLHQAIDAVRSLPVPVVAVLEGRCYGAAMELAAACDIRIGATDLISGMPEVRVGLPSVIEACLLPRLIGWGRTSELLLTGRDITGQENAQIGFVERITNHDEIDAGLEDWIQAILAAAPEAVRAQKAVMRHWQQDDTAAIAASIDAFSASYATGEPAAFLARVLEKKT